MTGSGPDDPELSVVSLQVGCVRITERFLTSDPPTATELGDAEAMVNDLLEQAIADHPRFLAAHRLVGLAGTVTTLASLNLGLEVYDRDQIHHAVLTAGDVYDWSGPWLLRSPRPAWTVQAWCPATRTSSPVGPSSCLR